MMGVRRQTEPVTGSGVLNYTFASSKQFVFEGIRLHLNAASETEENFVIQLESGRGGAFNVKLYSKDMNTVQDIIYQPEIPHNFEAGDVLRFTWTNTNLRTYGMEIVFKAPV